MHLMKTNFAKNVVAFGLTAALALGGTAAMGTASLVEEAYAADSLETQVDSSAASTTFTFSDDAIAVSGDESGYEVDGTDLTIKASGTYCVTGSCADGTIAVKKGVSGVTLILDNLTLAKDGDKAIKFKAGSSGNIVLIGTNTLSTSNDKGIIKANAEADDNDEIVYASDGTTTGGDLVISGSGTLNLSSDYSEVVDGETEGCDGINCEGDLEVQSGTFNIAVTDDGMHADNTLTIGGNGTTGPTINITEATEGLEGATVNLLSGTGDIVTSDDGVNAANSDLTTYGWQYGIAVSGGTWNVVAAGDGLDSNGNLTISGGTTEVYCTGSGNGAVDYGEGEEGEIQGTFTIEGGTLFAVGSDMMVAPSSGSYVVFGGQGAGMGMQLGQMSGALDQSGDQSGQMSGVPGETVGQSSDTSNQSADASGQAGQSGSQQMQVSGDMAQQSGATLVTKGETTTVSSSSEKLFETVASASGSYALFACDGLDTSAELTLQSGDTTTSSTAGTGSSADPTQQQGQQGQMPGQPGQDQQGQQSGQPGQPGQSGDQNQGVPPEFSGQTPPAAPADGTAPDANANAANDAATSSSATSSESTAKAENTMSVTKKKKTVKASVLKNKAKKVKAIKVKNAQGTVTYSKVSGSKYLKVNKKTGKITVKKGTPKGTYKIKVKVKAAGNSEYEAATKTVTVKIKVK